MQYYPIAVLNKWNNKELINEHGEEIENHLFIGGIARNAQNSIWVHGVSTSSFYIYAQQMCYERKQNHHTFPTDKILRWNFKNSEVIDFLIYRKIWLKLYWLLNVQVW